MDSLTITSRRRFISQSASLLSGTLFAVHSQAFSWVPGALTSGVQLGVITYSFRSMPGSLENILGYCKQCGITGIELMGDAVEVYAGCPTGQASREQRDADMRTWRENVSMEKFKEVRKMFNSEGIRIYAFKPSALHEKNTDAEIGYAMRAAKALGADSVTVELPGNPAHSKRLGDLASRYKVYVGYHAHTQATDTAWDEALSQSLYNSINLDCGHYIAAGGKNTRASLLAFIEARHERITSMHIKDRQDKNNGGANLEWGKGDTPIKEILQLMKDKKYRFPATIELEYPIPPGSDAVKEVIKCLDYAKKVFA